MAKSRKVSFKKVFGLILLLLVVVTVVGVITAYTGKETKTISATEFSRGGLDEFGEYVKTDKTLYTKDMFKCKGLKITQDFESNLSYRVYFYGYDEKFLTSSETFRKETKEFDVPSYAKYARVVLIPDGDEDIGFFDVYSIANDVEITVSKEQPDALVDYYELAKRHLITEVNDVPTVLTKGEMCFSLFYNGTSYSKSSFSDFSEDAVIRYNLVKLDCDKVAQYKITFGKEINNNMYGYLAYFLDIGGSVISDIVLEASESGEIFLEMPSDNAVYCFITVPLSSDGRELPIVINEYLSR